MGEKVITHYWDVVNLTNPYGVTWLCADGSIVYGSAWHGEIPAQEDLHPCSHQPEVIHGVDPENPKEPMDFGSWRPVSEWLAWVQK